MCLVRSGHAGTLSQAKPSSYCLKGDADLCKIPFGNTEASYFRQDMQCICPTDWQAGSSMLK